MLALEGVEANIYVATTFAGEQVTTVDGFRVRFLALNGLARPWLRFPLLQRTPVGRCVWQAANAGAMLRSLRSALIADGVDVLCVQEYWTARLDLLVRAVELPVVAIDQGLPDRHEVKLLKRGSFKRTAGVVVQTEREAAKIARYGGDARGSRTRSTPASSVPAPGGSAELTPWSCSSEGFTRLRRGCRT